MVGRGRRIVMWTVAGVIASCLLPLTMFAATTGQVKGQLIDKKTKEPVVGASVQVLGTQLGGMTDFDGKYIITRVDPGTYAVRITHLEYNTVEVADVNVTTDHTVEVNQSLEKKVTDLGKTIKVTAEHNIIDKFVTDNRQVISRETIDRQPVTTVDKLLSQVAGVVTGAEGEIFIRGGRAGEVAYIVDGVPIGDPLGGLGEAGANLSLVSGSIQEFTVIKDGFDPEYGNALSGIIKVRTATGNKENTNINIQYQTDDFGTEDLNTYSRNNDFVRFSISGPDPIFKSKVLPALGLHFLEDKEFTYYFYAEMDKSDGFYQYTRFDSPATRRSEKSFSLLGLNLPERTDNRYYYVANVKFRPRQNMKFVLSYKNRQVNRTLFDWQYRFSSQTAPVRTDRWQSLSLEISQAVRRNLNYEAIFSISETGVDLLPGDPNNPGHGLDPHDFRLSSEWESFTDRNGNGVYDAPEPVFNIFPDTVAYGTGYAGPLWTFGEFQVDQNTQGATQDFVPFQFNDNGYSDFLEGEGYIDLNGNGIWDQGDFLQDKNGNGLLDQDRISPVKLPVAEPFVDGDSIIGEPFRDVNGNDIYEAGVDIFIKSTGPDNMDFNHNGQYDGPPTLLAFQWEPGIPFEDRNGNGIFDMPNNQYDPGEQFLDINGNSVWDGGGSAAFLNPGSYDEDATWHFRNTKTMRGELKLFWQLGAHELKGGVAIDKNDFSFQEITKPYLEYTGRFDGGPFPDRGAFRDMWQYDPWGGQVYFRDKLEYGSMIASLGFRWDFFIQDKNDLIDIARNDDLGSGVILGDRQKFSPRIGFSYPISDKAKVHFNYGHFFQLPAFTRMFRRNTTSVNEDAIIGNYNLDYEKTIQYSFGVKYAMSDNYSVDFSGYFKDEFDKINSQSVRVGGLTRQQFRNSDYGRSRGVEVQLEKRGGGYVNGLITYTYAFAFGKASQSNEDYQTDFQISREPLSEAPLDNDIRHRLTASVQVAVPSTVKPRLFGLPIPNGWSASVITVIESGEPFTPSKDFPGISTRIGEDIQRNSLRLPATINFDVRVSKDFELVGMDYRMIFWVENLFDNRNVKSVFPGTGRADTQQNQAQTDGSRVILGGTPFDSDPANWDFGRQIRLGVEVNL